MADGDVSLDESWFDPDSDDDWYQPVYYYPSVPLYRYDRRIDYRHVGGGWNSGSFVDLLVFGRKMKDDVWANRWIRKKIEVERKHSSGSDKFKRLYIRVLNSCYGHETDSSDDSLVDFDEGMRFSSEQSPLDDPADQMDESDDQNMQEVSRRTTESEEGL